MARVSGGQPPPAGARELLAVGDSAADGRDADAELPQATDPDLPRPTPMSSFSKPPRMLTSLNPLLRLQSWSVSRGRRPQSATVAADSGRCGEPWLVAARPVQSLGLPDFLSSDLLVTLSPV